MSKLFPSRFAPQRFALTTITVGVLSCALPAAAQTPAETLDADASDPARMGWMVGSPPPANRLVRFDDGSFFQFPARRWSVSNFRQLMPTTNVSRGTGAPGAWPSAQRKDLDSVQFLPNGSNQPMSWEQALKTNYTDGVVVIHQGKIVYERYFGVLKPEGQHGAMSITKTFVGTLAASMVADGTLDPNRRVDSYVPEMAPSAFGSATVRQLMDMTTGIRFSENYADPKADIWAHSAAGNPLPKPKDYTGPRSYHEFLQTVQPEGTHGEAFHYRTANTDALGWVLARVSGRTVAQLLSERIWSRLGMEQDAYMAVDSTGTPFAGGGLSCGLRDLARFGELMRNEGRYNGLQIIPQAAVKDIQHGGSQEAFAKSGYKTLEGWSYRSMWWITHNPHGAYMARGVFGQTLYIDPKAEMVIARFASHPQAANASNDATSLPAYHAMALHLMGSKR